MIVVGIPGVGKTTVIDRLVRLTQEKRVKTKHVVYGTVMMGEAEKIGIKDRDQMRKLPVEKQRKLQSLAARSISRVHASFLIIDTHLFIKTQEGYWPGLPINVLKILKPTNVVLVDASAPVIVARRAKDATRHRDAAGEAEVERDKQIAVSMLGSTAVSLGVPALIVENREGKADEAALQVLQAMGIT